MRAMQADVYHAIADPTRRGILDALGGGEKSVSVLARPFRVSQPAISQHLRVLRAAGLVSQRKQGRLRCYTLVPERLKAVYDWVGHYERFWRDRLTALGEYLDDAGQATRVGSATTGDMEREDVGS